MTSKTIKCANCNVVIDELLAFVMNKIDVMDHESLMRVCVSTFNVAEVENSKKLLFDSMVTDVRNIKRKKGDTKIHKDLEDIITVLKSADPENIPIFVAKDLHKLPPVTFDHIDVTTLLKDLLMLRTQLAEIKSNYVTTENLRALEKKLSNSTETSSANSDNIDMSNKNNKNLMSEGSCTFMLPVLASTTTERTVGESHQSRSLLRVDNSLEQGIASPIDDAHSGSREASKAANITTDFVELPVLQHKTGTEVELQKSFASLVANENGLEKNTHSNDWILVQNKRVNNKNKFVMNKGKAYVDNNSKFKSADVKVPLFITHVHKDVTEEDVAEYIMSKINEKVVPIKIKMARVRSYNAFKFFVSKTCAPKLLHDSFWPNGISFRRFINNYYKDKDKILQVPLQAQVESDYKGQPTMHDNV
ncbi:hypothetical protein SFRURICE_021154 [Spodoptera frugiperda]|uniref:SFRICE_020376 n=1 Tax=Spodoptera frugiperda TaxID=7108 RepID=A0A2H1W7C0_SPOFR|nr:hypothetical protein SFRURICE_021154 [Spodoptera frugiperda]